MIKLNLKSPELAEFIGILIGDGFIAFYPPSCRIIQITGNKANDKEYYEDFVIPLIKKLFRVRVNYYTQHNCIRLTIYSRKLLEALSERIGFPLGKKGSISIPHQILETEQCRKAVLRGLFDTLMARSIGSAKDILS